jgi:Protein of unknown function (DUF3703)
MSRFSTYIRTHVTDELDHSIRIEKAGHSKLAFTHLERAHVLGQASTREHVRTHVYMLRWALRNGQLREAFGQVVRVFGALTKTAVGLVPEGNTGGANISPFKSLPVPPELARIIAQAHRH